MPVETRESNIEWLLTLQSVVGGFLDRMASQERPGYHRYAATGDRWSSDRHWNLGAAVFALKTYWAIGRPTDERIQHTIDYVRTFQSSEGHFTDPTVESHSLPSRLKNTFRRLDLSQLSNERYRRAETRQALSALRLFDALPLNPSPKFPFTPVQFQSFLEMMNWEYPWESGSHFSHACFFARIAHDCGTIDRVTYDEFRTTAIEWIAQLQHDEDGCWYRGKPVLSERLNGAMKVISGLVAIDSQVSALHCELVDTCLKAEHKEHACDLLNATYVLRHTRSACPEYRSDDIQEFAERRLADFRTHYFPDWGGFSFYPDRSNHRYYGARVSAGHACPDMHGTVLFVWGAALVSELLGLGSRSELRTFMT